MVFFMLLHSPAFADRIRAAKGSFRIFAHPLQPLFDAFDAYEKGDLCDVTITCKEGSIKARILPILTTYVVVT